MQLKESVTRDEVIVILNEAVKADQSTMSALVQTRIPCNEALDAHPTIQTGPQGVGILGILNGFFGISADGWGGIVANIEFRCLLDREHTTGTQKLYPKTACGVCGGAVAEVLLGFARSEPYQPTQYQVGD